MFVMFSYDIDKLPHCFFFISTQSKERTFWTGRLKIQKTGNPCQGRQDAEMEFQQTLLGICQGTGKKRSENVLFQLNHGEVFFSRNETKTHRDQTLEKH